MVKILYLFQTMGIGGAEQLLLTTLKYLDRGKFEAVVYSIQEHGQIGKEIEGLGYAVTSLERKPRMWDFRIIVNLVRVFKKEKPDILHANLFLPSYFGRVAAFFAGIPVVIITEHGTYSNFKRFQDFLIDSFLSCFTTKIIAVSEAVKRYLIKHTFVSKRKIMVMHNAMDFDRFDRVYGSDKAALRDKFGFSGEDILVGSVANISPWKGQLFLLKAVKEACVVLPRIRLCFIGRDNNGFRGELEKYAKENGFYGNVHFLGERRDIPEIMNMLDLFVSPSSTEGFGLSVIEAMYMGLPVIATDTEGQSEIIEDEKDGLMVPFGDVQVLAGRIIALSRDIELAARIGSSARSKVSARFSPKAYVRGLGSLYEECLAKSIRGKK